MFSGAKRKTVALGLVLAGVFLLAAWFRLRTMGSVAVLQDGVGPFWAAIRADGRAHSPGYGVGLLLPYAAITGSASSLWGAVGLLGWAHSALAPLAAWSAFQAGKGNWLLATLVGVLVAQDSGFVGSFVSGAEGYLGPLFVAACAFARGGWAWVALAFAVSNHPLAACAFPLVLRQENANLKAVWGMAIAAAMVVHQFYGVGAPGVPGGGLVQALDATLQSSGGLAIMAALGPLVALAHPNGRAFGLRVIASAAVLLCAGLWLGYLRDHHIRLLLVPALACWGSLESRAWWLMILGFATFDRQPRPPEDPGRAGTLQLTNAIGDSLFAEGRPLFVDRIWISGGPGVEPAAVMLDLHLRGWDRTMISGSGDAVIVVAGDPEELEEVGHPGRLIRKGHGYRVSRATVEGARLWSLGVCDRGGRPGGAWDALSVLDPSAQTEAMNAWWACGER